MAHYLGIDIGTSATKAVVIDGEGAVVGVGSAPHELLQPRPGWTEQDPVMWWRATCAAVREAVKRARERGHAIEVRGVSFSGQMHGSVFLDAKAIREAGSCEIGAVRPALLWNDQRTAEQCAAIEAAVGGRAELVRRVGNAALTGFTLPKILWVREHEPELWSRVSAVCTPKDYVRLAMTGELAQDLSDGAGMLLVNVAERAWHTGVMETLGLDSSLFPRLLESAAPAGVLTTWAAGELGLEPGTLVVAGAGDNQAGAVGAGVVEPGMVFASLGTSGVIYAHAAEPALDDDRLEAAGRVHTMCAATGTEATPGQWSITGVMLSAAGSLQWARDTLAPGEAFDALMNEAAGVAPGCEGLVFMPQLTGERCPYPDPKARGGWLGLSARHTRAHLVRAVIEGVTMTMAQVLDIVRSIGVPVVKARLSGGGNKSELWRQMQADLYGCPVATLNAEEGPAYGGALLAGVGAGAWSSVPEACAHTLEETEVREPGADAPRYEAVRRVLESAYALTRPAMHELDNAGRDIGD